MQTDTTPVSMENSTTMATLGSNGSAVPYNYCYDGKEILRPAYCVIGALGALGNSFVCLVLLSVKSRTTSINTLIVNQSFIDLFTSAVLFFLNIIPQYTFNNMPEGVLGDFLCKIWFSKYLMWATIISSTFNLVVLSLERLVSIVNPTLHLNKVSNSRWMIKAVCAAVWILGFLYHSYWMSYVRIYEGRCCNFAIYPKSIQYTLGFIVIILEYLGPLALMVIAYLMMAQKLRSRDTQHVSSLSTAARLSAHTGNGANTVNTIAKKQETSFSTARKNIHRTLVIVFSVFAICWGPNQITYFLYNMGVLGDAIFGWSFYHFTVVLAFSNCFCNPLVYSVKYKHFQAAAKALFKCKNNHVGIGMSGIGSTAGS